MKTGFLLPAALLALTLAGCKSEQAPQAAPEPTATVPSEPTSAPVPASAASFTVDPAALRVCEKKPQVATLKWEAAAAASVKQVELWVSQPGKEPKLFARAGASGEKQTGPWAKAGMQFELRDAANGTVLSHLEIASTPCP